MAAYPPVDLGRCVRDALAARLGTDPATFPESRLLGAAPWERPELASAASPLTHIRQAPDLPPFLIAHGTADVAVAAVQSELLHRALTDRGADAELYLVDGYKHGFLNPGGRMEAGLSDVMDDGRLEAEGPAPARRVDSTGAESHAEFGFETIREFFRTRL